MQRQHNFTGQNKEEKYLLVFEMRCHYETVAGLSELMIFPSLNP